MNKTKLSLMLAASMLATAGTASASDVDWVVAPYFWIPNIDADVSIKNDSNIHSSSERDSELN